MVSNFSSESSLILAPTSRLSYKSDNDDLLDLSIPSPPISQVFDADANIEMGDQQEYPDQIKRESPDNVPESPQRLQWVGRILDSNARSVEIREIEAHLVRCKYGLNGVAKLTAFKVMSELHKRRREWSGQVLLRTE